MQAAPSVVVDLRGSRGWAIAVSLLGAAAAGGLCAAVLSHAGVPDTVAVVGTAAAACAGAGVAWRWVPDEGGRLAWDGTNWLLDGEPGQVQVMLDLGTWMLLAFRPSSRRPRRWLAVSDHSVPQALGLRAAVYCRALPIQNNPLLPGRSPE